MPLTVDFDCRVEQFVNWMATLSNSERLLTTRQIVLSPANPDTKAVRAQREGLGIPPGFSNARTCGAATELDPGGAAMSRNLVLLNLGSCWRSWWRLRNGTL